MTLQGKRTARKNTMFYTSEANKYTGLTLMFQDDKNNKCITITLTPEEIQHIINKSKL